MFHEPSLTALANGGALHRCQRGKVRPQPPLCSTSPYEVGVGVDTSPSSSSSMRCSTER